MRVAFAGTRGSIPSPGPGTVRYGGNTPCLTVRSDRGQRLVLDAGTGIRAVGRSIVESRTAAPESVVILLTHTHWDHIQGLPFFLPLFSDGDLVRIHGPAQPSGVSLAAIIERQMDPTVFPVPVSALAETVDVAELADREMEIGHFTVATVDACHPGATVGYAIRETAGGRSLIYLTDNELQGFTESGRRAGLVRFLRQADTLVHDAMYFERELAARRGWGHSSAADAVRVALEAECPRLVLFHHDPGHDDESLDRLLEEALLTREQARGDCEIVLAAEGMTLSV